MMNERTIRRARSTRRAFTLTELLVAIGVVTILTVAVGQLFQGVSGVVSSGVATSEVDQMARAIERQLRDDFRALNRMAPEETFIAIRMREIGDHNRNEEVDGGNEQALYLSQEDKDFDEQNDLDPYEVVSEQVRSRAVTRRVDDMIFLAPASTGSQYPSFQLNDQKVAGQLGPGRAPSAQHARIYIGHALKPAPDRDFQFDADDPTARTTPIRYLLPDGDFGSARPEDNRFAQFAPFVSEGINNNRVTGLNEFAGQWTLARQAALLIGGEVAGPTPPSAASGASGARFIGTEFAPYIRDAEAFLRFDNSVPPDDAATLNLQEMVSDETIAQQLYEPRYPEPRLLSWGRVDVIAQSKNDVERWLEGENADWMSGETPGATAYVSGYFRFEPPAVYDEAHPAFHLWQRVDDQSLSSDEVERINKKALRSAIAGCFLRPQQTAVPPRIERRPPQEYPDFQPFDALMDTHALIATRCSNFEIAWSDGSTAKFAIDLDGDSSNGDEVKEGDIIWFDISPTVPDNPASRSTYRWWWDNHRRDVDFRSNPGLSPSDPARDRDFPEILPEDAIDLLYPRMGSTSGSFLWTEGGSANNTGVYNVDFTGGEPIEGVNFEDRTEYLAIWPFRVPDGTGGYDGSWPKNDLLIRIRMTLHDSQFRLEEGKEFEFIFEVDLGS